MVEIPSQMCKPVTLSVHITKAITETSDEEILITHWVFQKLGGIHSTCKVFLAMFCSPAADRPRRQYYSYIREGGAKPSACLDRLFSPICDMFITSNAAVSHFPDSQNSVTNHTSRHASC